MARPMQTVKIYEVQDRRSTKQAKLPWVVRYIIDGRHRSKSFRTRIEADRYRGLLLQAVQDGGRFDESTGEPESWQTPLADMRSRVVATLARRTMGGVATTTLEQSRPMHGRSAPRREHDERWPARNEVSTSGHSEPGCDGGSNRRDRHPTTRKQDVQGDDRCRLLRRPATVRGGHAPSPLRRTSRRRMGTPRRHRSRHLLR